MTEHTNVIFWHGNSLLGRLLMSITEELLTSQVDFVSHQTDNANSANWDHNQEHNVPSRYYMNGFIMVNLDAIQPPHALFTALVSINSRFPLLIHN